MDLAKFPMDVQRCSLIYESFSYNRDEVRMQWGDRPDPVWPLKNFTLPDFVLTHMANSSGTVVSRWCRKTRACSNLRFYDSCIRPAIGTSFMRRSHSNVDTCGIFCRRTYLPSKETSEILSRKVSIWFCVLA